MPRDPETGRRRGRPIDDSEPGFMPPMHFVVLIVGLLLAIAATFL